MNTGRFTRAFPNTQQADPATDPGIAGQLTPCAAAICASYALTPTQRARRMWEIGMYDRAQ